MSGSFVAALWGKPKAKPWDFVKGRRFRCCHWLTSKGHGPFCLAGQLQHMKEAGGVIRVPRYGRVSVEDLSE